MKKPLYKAFIATRDFEGVTGQVSLRKSGDSVKSAMIKEIASGQMRFKAEVKPKVKGSGH